MISNVVKARKMLSNRCTSFLAHMVSNMEIDPSTKETSIISEFLDVFLNELLRLAFE